MHCMCVYVLYVNGYMHMAPCTHCTGSAQDVGGDQLGRKGDWQGKIRTGEWLSAV